MRKYRGRNVKRSRKPHGNPEEGKEINSLLAEAPVPLPLVEQEAPHLIQLHKVSTSSPSLVLGLTISSLVDSSAQEKKGETQEWNVQKMIYI